MDDVARLRAAQRRELFQETAAQRGMTPAIVEKDFWVCWTLRLLFTDDVYAEHLVFKGGTSLSKAYSLIERFSEDIDLVLDWRLLGYGPDAVDPMTPQGSKTKQHKLNASVNDAAARYLAERFIPHLRGRGLADVGLSVSPVDDNPLAVALHYPTALPTTDDYLRPELLLEIGPLASWVPKERREVRPYAAEAFPQLFRAPTCEVEVISAARTFWEKATILHAEAHRAADKRFPPRYSRHYYDLFKLATSPVRAQALADLALLDSVVAFKQQFYPSPWARYDEAHPGLFRLLPEAPDRRREHAADYEKMKFMIFGAVPTFDAILDELGALEREINALEPPA
ncbi:MAG: nucleotidyl transferase AbiEii/AbiGii toxin family protein [Deltaproteobacteria bacterium]|nr:nucleotidyl transferase AbiEii/AbiGii toxin family protein [Deltaproteobacteria bacterium]